MSAFDDYLALDWSAASRPRRGADSIWIARARRRARSAEVRLETCNPATRTAASAILTEWCASSVADGRRVLVGVDLPLGLPHGFFLPAEDSVGVGAEPGWLAWWQWLACHLNDDLGGDANRNDRFALADDLNRRAGTRWFWGRPATAGFSHLSHLPPRDVEVDGLRPNPTCRLRRCERPLAGRGIKSAWQLFGGVTVGSQMLTALPRLFDLRRSFGDAVCVWPFEPERLGEAAVVIAELWPGQFVSRAEVDAAVASGRGVVADELQVTTAARRCAEADRDGVLRGWLASVGGGPASAAATEEGWILGVAP